MPLQEKDDKNYRLPTMADTQNNINQNCYSRDQKKKYINF